MPDRDAVLKGKGQRGAHLNYGSGQYGYRFHHVEFPRLAWVDRHGTRPLPPREWFVDGASVGVGEEGLAAALTALDKPVELTPIEADVLAMIPEEFADLREVEELIAGSIEVPDGVTVRSSVFALMWMLREKGQIEYWRRSFPAGTTPFPHLAYAPTVRRRKGSE